jgi:molybdenum cofactor sulfurtransferase
MTRDDARGPQSPPSFLCPSLFEIGDHRAIPVVVVVIVIVIVNIVVSAAATTSTILIRRRRRLRQDAVPTNARTTETTTMATTATATSNFRRLLRHRDDDDRRRLEDKMIFLDGPGRLKYGYVNSNRGYIDNWRGYEFPTLIRPMMLPRSHRLYRRRRRRRRREREEREEKDADDDDDDDDEEGDDDHRGIGPMDEDNEPEVYLDYAGSSLPTRTMMHVEAKFDRIATVGVLANPHSEGGGPASDRTISFMRESVECVMDHFGIHRRRRRRRRHDHDLESLDGSVDDVDDEDRTHEDDSSAGTKNIDGRTSTTSTTTMSIRPDYRLVFTSGATESLRLVAERFPWDQATIVVESSRNSLIATTTSRSSNDGNNDRTTPPLASSTIGRIRSIRVSSLLLYPRNVHTSVIGMRQIAMDRDAHFHCVSVDELLSATPGWFRDLLEGFISHEFFEDGCDVDVDGDVRLEEKKDEVGISNQANGVPSGRGAERRREWTDSPRKTIWMHHLLVLPLECNFGGDRFDWSDTASAAQAPHVSSYHLHRPDGPRGERSTIIRICHKWHILMDTAKAAATSPVDLPTLANGRVDFAAVSFYKLFGSPTGLGALFVRMHPRRRSTTEGICRIAEIDYTSSSSKLHNSIRNTTAAKGDFKQHFCHGMRLERSRPRRHFFGGGSVDVVLPEEDYMVSRNIKTLTIVEEQHDGISPHEDERIDLGAMSHGTEHFRGIVNLVHGFRELDDVGGMGMVSSRRHGSP